MIPKVGCQLLQYGNAVSVSESQFFKANERTVEQLFHLPKSGTLGTGKRFTPFHMLIGMFLYEVSVGRFLL